MAPTNEYGLRNVVIVVHTLTSYSLHTRKTCRFGQDFSQTLGI
jgi:hypothetical protein